MRISDRAMAGIKMGLTIAQFTGTPEERLDAENAMTDIQDLVPDQCELCGAWTDNGETLCDECSEETEAPFIADREAELTADISAELAQREADAAMAEDDA